MADDNDRDAATPKSPGLLGAVSPWKKKLLLIALALGIAGLALQGYSRATAGGAPEAPAGDAAAAGRSLLPDEAPVAARDLSLPERLAPWLSRVGLSFAGGFVLGFVFRTFLRTMAMLTAAAVVLFAALSYFGLFNVDFTQVQTQWDSASQWMTDQAGRLREVVAARLPSTFTGAAGAFLGFARR